MARWVPTLMGLTWREVSGSVALKSGRSVCVMFPLTFCYLSSGHYFTRKAMSVVDTQWKQSTHHLALVALKRSLGILMVLAMLARQLLKLLHPQRVHHLIEEQAPHGSSVRFWNHHCHSRSTFSILVCRCDCIANLAKCH